MRFLAIYVVLLLTYSCFLINPTSAVSQGIIDLVCRRTQYPNLCKDIFEGDPRTASATPAQLSKISIYLMLELAVEGVEIFRNAIDNNPNEVAAKNCLRDYIEIETKSRQAYALSVKGRYEKISQFTESARLALRCEAEYRTRPFPILNVLDRAMIFRCQIAKSVNQYVQGH